MEIARSGVRRRRSSRVIIPRRWDNVLRRHGALADRQLDPDLAVRPTRRSDELVRADLVLILRVGQVLEVDQEGPDQGFGGLGGFRVKNFEGEDGIGEGEGERDRELFVPDGSGRAAVVGLGGEAAIGIDPEDGVGLEVAILPVDVLEVLGVDDGEVELEGLRRRDARGGHLIRDANREGETAVERGDKTMERGASKVVSRFQYLNHERSVTDSIRFDSINSVLF